MKGSLVFFLIICLLYLVFFYRYVVLCARADISVVMPAGQYLFYPRRVVDIVLMIHSACLEEKLIFSLRFEISDISDRKYRFERRTAAVIGLDRRPKGRRRLRNTARCMVWCKSRWLISAMYSRTRTGSIGKSVIEDRWNDAIEVR